MAAMNDVDPSKLSDFTLLDNDLNLEGDIAAASTSETEYETENSTLNEPIRTTILRDLNAVSVKFKHVFYPKQNEVLLKEWDLWGPLVLCLILSTLLQSSSSNNKDQKDDTKEVHFAEIFVLVWVGAILVTLNSKLLGGTLSFFQSVCVLGYCLFPLTLASVINAIILLAAPHPDDPSQKGAGLFAVRVIVVLSAFGWSTFASTAFLADSQPPRRKSLAVYPIFLFYFVISWLIISHSGG